MMQTLRRHKSMPFWYVTDQIDIDRWQYICYSKNKPKPLRHHREEKTLPVLGHAVNFVRKFEQNSVFSDIRLHQNKEAKSHELLHFNLHVLLGL